VTLKRWNGKLGRATGIKEDIKSFNAFLSNYQSRVYQTHSVLYEKGEAITAEAIKKKLLGKDETIHMLIEDEKVK
jgi:hypothetical protein